MMVIEVHKGDITRLEVDAIVNAANNYLWMGSGVAGAIKKAGGVFIEEAAVKRGPIPIGSAVVTGAGALKARYVIHAAVMGQDLQTNAAYIRKAAHSSLICADELDINSIAFPALGTGVGGFSLDECADIMISEVKQYVFHKTTGLVKVIFVLFDELAYRVFREGLAKFERGT